MILIVDHTGMFWKVSISVPYKVGNKVNFKALAKIKIWCNENITNKWTYVGYDDSKDIIYTVLVGAPIDTIWHFYNEEDAVQFELTWG